MRKTNNYNSCGLKRIISKIINVNFLLLSFLLLTKANLFAQCPQFFNSAGVASSNPYWISCSGGAFNLFIQSPTDVGPYTIDWGDGNNSAGASLLVGNFVTHNYVATVDTFVVTITETSSGCVVTGVVVMEQQTNASIITFGGLTRICAPNSLSFVNQSANVSETTIFTWDFGDGSPPLVTDFTNAGQTISNFYDRNEVNCETVVTLSAQNYCNLQSGGPTVATFGPIEVYDRDVAAITPNNNVLCFPDNTVLFTNTTAKNCLAEGNVDQRFEFWNFGDYWSLGHDSIINWSPFDPPARPGYSISYPGIGTYTVMMVDSSLCGRDTAYTSIVIVPPPIASLTISKDTICAGESIVITNTSLSGTQFLRNFANGGGFQAIGGIGSTATRTYNAAGNYVIALVASINGSSSCSDTAFVNLHVKARPNSDFVIDDNIGCDTLIANFSDASVNAIAWNWDFGNGNTFLNQIPPTQLYTATGNYNVSLQVTATNLCTHSVTKTVNVFQSPVVSFTPANVCQNSIASFTDNSVSSAGDPIISRLWKFGDGNTSTSATPNNTYVSASTFVITLTVNTANCSSTLNQNITVNPLPISSFSYSPLNGCPPLEVNFLNLSSGATSYTWLLGNGTNLTSTNALTTYTNFTLIDSIYNNRLIAISNFGCRDTSLASVVVFPGANAQFTHNGTPSCAPFSVSFSSNTTNANSYNWNFDDGNSTTGTSVNHLFNNSTAFLQTFDVSLVATTINGCKDSTNQTITAYPQPIFSFTPNPISGCSPFTTTMPIVAGAAGYDWDFGDGNSSSLTNASNTYFNTGNSNLVFEINLTATSPFGCVGTAVSSITVFPLPNAQFSTSVNSGCSPFQIQLNNNSVGATSYTWNYGDATSSTNNNLTHNYTYTNVTSSNITNNIVLTAISVNNCVSTFTSSIDVFPEVKALFTTDTASCSPLSAAFTNNSINANSFVWSTGDGTNYFTNSPSHTYFKNPPGDAIFEAQLIAINTSTGCKDTLKQNMYVYVEPIADFIASPTSQVFPSKTVSFTNLGSLGSWNYGWNFNNGQTSTNQAPLPVNYSTWGTYTITNWLESNFCADTITKQIIILPPIPIASFSGQGKGCAPLTTVFTNLSTYSSEYLWEFGDGGTSSAENPEYIYNESGIYTVKLLAKGEGGENTIIKQEIVEVHPRAKAFFKAQPDTVFIPSQGVQFYNLSSDADSYIWNFGDTEFSTEKNPIHFYQSEGSYDVFLIADNEFLCKDSFLLKSAVIAEVSGEISYPNAFIPDPSGPNGGKYESNSVDNKIFFPIFKGVNEYHLMIFNRWGELIFESFDVSIGWDGYYRGNICQQEVYVWKVKARFYDGTVYNKTGDVTLIR